MKLTFSDYKWHAAPSKKRTIQTTFSLVPFRILNNTTTSGDLSATEQAKHAWSFGGVLKVPPATSELDFHPS